MQKREVLKSCLFFKARIGVPGFTVTDYRGAYLDPPTEDLFEAFEQLKKHPRAKIIRNYDGAILASTSGVTGG